MEISARDYNQNASRVLAAAEHGQDVTITKNGRPVAILAPYRRPSLPPYPPGPIGDIDIPTFTGPGDLTDEDIDDLLAGMGDDR